MLCRAGLRKIGRAMDFSHSARSDAPPPAAAASMPAAPSGGEPGHEPPRPAAAPARLLLFVGESISPDAALAALLGRDGLRCLSLPGAEQAVRAAALARFDAVLVDAALADGPASRTLEALAAAHRCPVLVLAECADEVDEIVALELGADLYLSRPLAPRRLRAHLRALLRRRATGEWPPRPQAAPSPQGAHALQAGGWTLQVAPQRLTRGTRHVRLTQAQTGLLRRLMAAGGDVVPADELVAALPHHERVHPRGLRVHVHRLRQRLRDEGVHELQLESVRGNGYLLAVACAEAA
ncbi:MAG: response regulator transcription factor [Rubrivivax sp.]|nr:response regulator transcription factor [Rubrivivax sp.]